MSSYLSSGVKGLDDMLGGGMIPGNSYLLEVEPGAQELVFIAAYLDEGLRKGDFCTLFVYDMPHEDIVNKLTDLGLNIRAALESGSAVIVDLWSEGKYDPEHNGPILMTNDLNDPNSILRLYYDAGELHRGKLETGRYNCIRIAVMSISSQIMNYRFEPSYKMNRIGLNMIRRRKALCLSVFNPKMFDETVTAALEQRNDGVIVLNMKEVKGRFQRFVRVKQSPFFGFYTDEVPYDIVDNRPYLLTSLSEKLQNQKRLNV